MLSLNCSTREVCVVTNSLNKLGERSSRSDRYVLSHVIFFIHAGNIKSNYDVCKT